LHYGQDKTYRPALRLWKTWNFQHQPPGATRPLQQATNTMPDLATAMKYNPDLRILLAGGYFDLATPFYEGWYEMHQLPIPERLQDHIDYRYYQSGHMVYAHQESLKALHDDVAAFIHSTDHLSK
jgi:carboxypeptidase C (cathepsin A)